MGTPLSVRLRNVLSNEESWIGRVRENVRAFFALRGVTALARSGTGAFSLIDARPVPGTRQRQGASLLLHFLVIGLLLALAQMPKPPLAPKRPDRPETILAPPLRSILFGETPSGTGKGGNHDLLPPSSGQLPLPSSIILVPPRMPEQREVILPVQPAVFDPNASTPNQYPREIGLPWMKDRNLSNGTGGGNTIGDKNGNSVGTSDTEGIGGESDYPGTYSPGMTQVKCMYCPDPEYTEEARKTKLQGTVTLRVLVGADGRAGRVKIIKGLGLGLDERAMDAVRQWRFEPARDAGRHAIPEWVTVETTYRLF